MNNLQALPDDALYLHEASLRKRSREATLEAEKIASIKELSLIKEEWIRRIATSPCFKTKEERKCKQR